MRKAGGQAPWLRLVKEPCLRNSAQAPRVPAQGSLLHRRGRAAGLVAILCQPRRGLLSEQDVLRVL